MTPRQIMAYMMLADHRLSYEKASDLNLNAMAARSEPKAIAEMTKTLLGKR